MRKKNLMVHITIVFFSFLQSCCSTGGFLSPQYPTSTTETITRTTVVAPPSYQAVPVSTPSIYQAPPQILQAPPCSPPIQANPCLVQSSPCTPMYQSNPCHSYQSAPPCQQYTAPAIDNCVPTYNLNVPPPSSPR